MRIDDVGAYAANLHEVMRVLRHVWGFNGPVVWLAPTASAFERLDGPLVSYKYVATHPQNRRFHLAAEEVMGAWGVPVIDPFPLSAARPDLAYDGQVCLYMYL